MKSFLKRNAPIITGMLKGTTKETLLAEIARIREDGAEAFGFQMDILDPTCKTKETLTELFEAMKDLPVYFTNYLRGNTTAGITWDDLEQEILLAADLGATLIDIPADMFASADMELTHDISAIARQKSLICELKKRGCEVLISSHVMRYIPKETVLSIAKEHVERGADISKIVTAADNDAELNENFEVQHILNRTLPIPYLFLCNGTHRLKHRLLGPLFGSAMFLTTENAVTAESQPKICDAKKLLTLNNLL